MKALLLLALAVSVAGCAGAGPASPSDPARGRCVASSAPDAQRPLFFLLCLESP